MDEPETPVREPGTKDRDPLRRVLVAAASACLFCVVAALAYLGWLVRTTPASEALQQIRIAQPTLLLASDGKPYASFRLQQQERVDLP